jgi:hypothetical protein
VRGSEQAPRPCINAREQLLAADRCLMTNAVLCSCSLPPLRLKSCMLRAPRPPDPNPATPCHHHPSLPSPTAPCSINVDDMRVEEMTAAHYLAFKEKLVPPEDGEALAQGRCSGLVAWSWAGSRSAGCNLAIVLGCTINRQLCPRLLARRGAAGCVARGTSCLAAGWSRGYTLSSLACAQILPS